MLYCYSRFARILSDIRIDVRIEFYLLSNLVEREKYCILAFGVLQCSRLMKRESWYA